MLKNTELKKDRIEPISLKDMFRLVKIQTKRAVLLAEKANKSLDADDMDGVEMLVDNLEDVVSELEMLNDRFRNEFLNT